MEISAKLQEIPSLAPHTPISGKLVRHLYGPKHSDGTPCERFAGMDATQMALIAFNKDLEPHKAVAHHVGEKDVFLVAYTSQ